MSQQINSIELLRTQPLVPPAVMKPQRPLQRQVHLRGRLASKPTVIRGITYYKAKVSEEENDIEEQRESGSEGQPQKQGREEEPFGSYRDRILHAILSVGLQLPQCLLSCLGQGTSLLWVSKTLWQRMDELEGHLHPFVSSFWFTDRETEAWAEWLSWRYWVGSASAPL